MIPINEQAIYQLRALYASFQRNHEGLIVTAVHSPELNKSAANNAQKQVRGHKCKARLGDDMREAPSRTLIADFPDSWRHHHGL